MGYFTHFNLLTMDASLSNRLLATAIVCSVLLQGCRSGLRAITEEPALQQDHPKTADHVQASGDTLSSGVLVLAPSRTDVRVSGALGGMVPTASVTAVVPVYSRVFMGPFTASSGERVLLGQRQGQWQAFLQGSAGAMMHRRSLPVVSSGDINTLLAGLQDQDAWSSRSRIHVLSAPHMSSTPCVYVGKLGLLGGAPEAAVEEKNGWVLGPELLIESSGKEDVTVYQIPSGYCYKGYEYKEKVLENVSVFKIYYVEANNEEEVRRLEALKSRRLVEGKLSAAINLLFGYVADLGHVEGVGNSLVVKGSGSVHTQRSKHAALVVYGSTKKNKTFSSQKEKSRIKVVLKVFLEEDTTPPQDVPPSPINAHSHTRRSSQVSDTTSQECWIQGPRMILGSDQEAGVVWHIPEGYRYKSYRLREGAVIQRANLKITYAAANNEEEYRRLVATQSGQAAAAGLGANVGQIVTLGKIEGNMGHSALVGHEGHDLRRTEHACLVLHGSTKKNKAFRPSRIDIQVEILVERVEETSSTNLQSSSFSSEADQGDAKPPAQAPSPAGSFTASQRREYEARRAAEARAELAEKQLAEEQARLAQEKEAAEAQARLAEEELAKERAKLAKEKEAADQQARLAEAKEAAEKRARLAKEELAKLKKQALLSQTAVPSMAFGAKEWAQYFGEVEPVHPPLGIDQILSGACPFWPGKQVKDTHLLVLIPSTVNGKPFSLDLLSELVQHPRGGGHATKYRNYDSDLKEQFGTQSPGRSYWALMTRDVLEGSRNKGYTSQKDLVAAHAKRTSLPYELPGALEAATAILSHYVRSGGSEERLYTDDPWTYTRCRELVAWNGENYPAAVGGFSSGGLHVDCNYADYLDSGGVAGFRKF